jgi:hypothetical protein
VVKITATRITYIHTRFEEMQKKFDERIEENAKKIREIKRMLEKMTSAK